MTSEEFIAKQKANLAKIANGEALQIAAVETHRAMANRIFNDGGAQTGQIGKYDTVKPLYVNPKNSPKTFVPEGKDATLGYKKNAAGSSNQTLLIKTTKKNKKGQFTSKKMAVKSNFEERKTKWFPSYSAFRQTIGRKTDKVNLNLSGRLQSHFVTGLVRKGNSTFVSVLKRQEDIDKKDGAEKHFGKKIFSLTDKERKLFISTVNKETQRILHA